ncbi:MAG TPA: alpha/beta fold hydrolase [Polyangiaceae bacterium]|jgi:3-oxoadipate enol-lactonase|nr:alpha/beta fold hydrolase [Polyangiaceae bacterium]
MPYVRTRLGRWFYEERGAAKRPGDPAIVLWHSLLFDGGMWKPQVEPLAALGRVVVFDGPGHGKSEVPPPFTLEDNADAVPDALAELGIDQAVFCGLSWGGMVGMRLALKYPAKVRALALLDTSAEAEDRFHKVKYRLFVSFGRRLGFPSGLAESQLGPIYFAESSRARDPHLVERFIRTVNGYPRDGIARASLAVVVHRKSVLDRLGQIKAPTLVLCGREDVATEPAHSERIAAAIPGAKLVFVERSGHISTLEQPAAVNEALVPFVAAQLGS